MTSLVIDVEDIRPVSVSFTETSLVVELADGRSIATPIDWYPRLAAATDEQRRNYELGPLGIHWPDIDEDLSVAGMLRGERAGRLENPGRSTIMGRSENLK